MIEKRFRVLCEIVRAQHFAWRSMAWSSACMGEDAVAEPGCGDEAL